MAERPNYLLAHGERLVQVVGLPRRRMDKQHPYTLDQAIERMVPRFEHVSATLDQLPAAACPNDEAVALLTLHPAYTARSFYPEIFLREAGLEALGSRARSIKPERTRRKEEPPLSETTELFVAGPRRVFRQLPELLRATTATDRAAQDLIKFEDFRAPSDTDRIRPLVSDAAAPLLEVVLHAGAERESIVAAFAEYVGLLGLEPWMDRRVFTQGLCFVPMEAPRELLEPIAQFSFLRLVREMPRLRRLQPMLRTTPKHPAAKCELRASEPLDKQLRVAVFDGGLPATSTLLNWARLHEEGVSAPIADGLQHGSAVTSAVLFGSLQAGGTAPQPYAYVDHYRVIDEDTARDDQLELYTVLDRIRAVLQRRQHQFVNLSIGPELPIDDNDVHAWTAVLDEFLSDGAVLASVAVGNGGELDRASGIARVQTPADCVNALCVGSADSVGVAWRRAPYSSIGPGRSPGVIKPDALSFGGSDGEPFWVDGGGVAGVIRPTMGTSFAAPNALRNALALRAHFGAALSPLAMKTLLVHHADLGGQPQEEAGWGRIPGTVADLVTSDDHTAHVVFQGELTPGQSLRMPVPVPAGELSGMVEIKATICYATATDPEDPVNYTRGGLHITFRPHADRRDDPDQMHAKSASFFQAHDHMAEAELRRDAHKWETTRKRARRFQGASLKDPVFDVHYIARESGHSAARPGQIRYALVVTISARKHAKLYDQVLHRYRTQLEPLRPVIQIPVRVA